MKPGPLNLITDVAGLRVGNAADATVKTGATVLVGDGPFVAAVHVMGGAPGTRETDLLAPDKLVQEVDALVLAGGSAFGLDAAAGVAEALRREGRGFDVGGQKVPIVPGAIVFDLLNGGDKDWDESPYRRLGREALAAAAGGAFALGSAGAGLGATTAALKGGLGSASLALDSGHTVGALVVVNAVGGVTGPEGQFWAAPWEMGGEFGGRGTVTGFDPGALPVTKLGARQSTTVAIVATDAALTQAQATRLAIAAHDGMARAIVPSHTPFDGDLVFAAATGAMPLDDPERDPLLLGHAAATCLARAIARGVHAATPVPGDLLPTWRERFGVT
ncbi:MAG: P1 family peptidase [Maritimibacter sp.]|nr:P1 family peptidase [Maritimibacter sp.]